MKRLLSILLVFVMSFTMTSTAFAATVPERETLVIGESTYDITTTQNTITVVDKNNGYEAVYVPSTGALTLRDLTGKEDQVCTNISVLKNANIDSESERMYSVQASNGSNSSRDNKYAYERSTKAYNNKYYTFWQIQIPNQIKMTWANANNTSTLEDFKANVDALRGLEDSVAGAWGTTILAAIIGVIGTLALPAIGAALVAVLSVLVGGDDLSTLLTYGTNMRNYRDNCESLFGQVIVYSIPS